VKEPKYGFNIEKQSDGYHIAVESEQLDCHKKGIAVNGLYVLLVFFGIPALFSLISVLGGVKPAFIGVLVFGGSTFYIYTLIQKVKRQKEDRQAIQEFKIKKDCIEQGTTKYAYEHICKIFIPGTSIVSSQTFSSSGGSGFFVGGTGATGVALASAVGAAQSVGNIINTAIDLKFRVS
jgi:hypothetical protein